VRIIRKGYSTHLPIRQRVYRMPACKTKSVCVLAVCLITFAFALQPASGRIAYASTVGFSKGSSPNGTYSRIVGELAILYSQTARYYLIDDQGPIELLLTSDTEDLYRYDGMSLQLAGYLATQNAERTLQVTDWSALEIQQAAASVSGPQSAIVILAEFSDNTAGHTVEYFRQLVFGNTGDAVNAYYVEVSFNQIQVTGDTTSQWYKLSHPTTYYDVHGWGSTWSEYRKLAADTVALVDPYVNFAAYDHYIMVFAGNWVWGARASGLAIPTDDLVTVNTATFQRETYEMSVFAHEFGHDLGLPDLYDYRYSDPYHFIDGWDLMSVDNAQHLSSWSKIYLGWIPPERIRTFVSGTLTETVERIEYSTVGYQALKILTSSSIYFLVETRQEVGYDFNLPASAPDHGVLITMINENRGSGRGIVRLVDANPATQSVWDGDAVWQVGQTYANTEYGFSVSIQSWTGTAFVVSVNQAVPELSVSLVRPSDGVSVSCNVRLVVKVTSSGAAVKGATVEFYVDSALVFTKTTDRDGKAKYKYCPTLDTHSWYATAEKTGYDPGASETRSFTVLAGSTSLDGSEETGGAQVPFQGMIFVWHPEYLTSRSPLFSDIGRGWTPTLARIQVYP